MKKYDKDSNSLLFSYYTLTHASASQASQASQSAANARTGKRNDAESGDETDRSVEPEHEVTESFIMDEINENTESCSLSSSRENLLDGECRQVAGRESRPGTRPNSRPSSARRTSMKTAELPVDERIKVLEEGLKEADIEREVVLSCLGKEYLERVTMQNYLREICTKSGYNYDEVIANMDAQSGAENILENMIEMRTKALVDKRNESSNEKPRQTEDRSVSKANGETIVTMDKEVTKKEDNNVLNSITEEKLKVIIAKVIEAEKEKVNIHTDENIHRDENSHTGTTKDQVVSNVTAVGENNSIGKETAGSSTISNASQIEKNSPIVNTDQSEQSNANMKKTNDLNEMYPEKNAALCRDGKTTNLCQNKEQSTNMNGFETKRKQNLLDLKNMPSLSDGGQENDGLSFLQSLERKSVSSSDQSLDSIDEGIYLLKNFLKDLANAKKRSPGRIVQLEKQDVNRASNSATVSQSDVNNRKNNTKPRRKLSLNETVKPHNQSDLRPQRRRSYAEGMNNVKPKTSSFESRLYRATVSSQNKMKDRISRNDSDSEQSKKATESSHTPRMTRSSTDYRARNSSNASTEDESSLDGDDDLRLIASQIPGNTHSFEYVYELDQEITNREYSKLVNVLDMLQNQKRKWEDEVRSLKEKIDSLKTNKAELFHDNNVLRKSLEAANHAIKEINAKVQELKLTIVPLRDENTKLREQNQSLKSKLDLLRKDKATLLQEFQELKNTKLKYEEKLQLVIDLYQNGRINLAADRSNNSTNEITGSFAKDGLKSLLDINGEKTKEKSRSIEQFGLRSIRNQDKSKRHSFHGFEKIDELANSEELVAEKEKIQEENSRLREELKEMKEKLSVKNEEDSMTEAEILNQRKNWRMQREESKHRIIREILKTESSQTKYGRAYSSCGDLTLAENDEYSSRSVWGGKKEGRRQKDPKRERDPNKDVTDGRRLTKAPPGELLEKTSDRNANSQRFSEDVNGDGQETDYVSSVDSNANSMGAVSWELWKKESEKLDERLSVCKFKNQGLDVESDKSTKLAQKLSKDRPNENKKTRQDVNNNRDESLTVGKDSENDSGEEIDISHPSNQWSDVKKKIQAIYGQPVEFSDGGNDEEDEDWVPNPKKKGISKYNGERRSKVLDSSSKVATAASARVTEEATAKREVKSKQYRETNRMSIQDMLAKHILEVVEGEVRTEQPETNEISKDHSDGDFVKQEQEREHSEWQRKSSEGEHDFEKYTEITKQRREQKNKVRTTSGSTESKMQDARVNMKKIQSTDLSLNESDIQTKQKALNGLVDPRDDSPWIRIPVYLKNGGETSTPRRDSKANNQPGSKSNDLKMERSKAVEETAFVSKVESAFASAKSASKKLFKKTTKSKTDKDGTKFVRRSAGTVMYLDEIADSDSADDSFERPTTIPRRSKSFRRARPKSEFWSGEREDKTERLSSEQGSSFKRVQSLRLPKQSKDDMFAVNIALESNSMHASQVSSSQHQHTESHSALKHSQSFQQQQNIHCNHVENRRRIQSETGTTRTRSEKRPKSPGGFSCELCRELTKKKNAQEKYCWEKYFPIGETTVESRSILFREDYV